MYITGCACRSRAAVGFRAVVYEKVVTYVVKYVGVINKFSAQRYFFPGGHWGARKISGGSSDSLGGVNKMYGILHGVHLTFSKLSAPVATTFLLQTALTL